MNEVNKISYFLGSHKIDASNIDHYLQLVRNLTEVVDKCLAADREKYIKENTLKKTSEWKDDVLLKAKSSLFASGCIINTPSYFADADPAIVEQFVKTVNPSFILIIDNDGLLSMLRNRPDIIAIKLPKNGGATMINESFKEKIFNMKLHSFFFDEKHICSRETVPLAKLSIFQVSKRHGSSSYLTGGSLKSELTLTKKDLFVEALNKAILGVTTLSVKAFSSLPDEQKLETLLKNPLMSVIYVSGIKDLQPAEASSPGGKQVDIIRPAYLQNDYQEYIILCGEIFYESK